MKKLETLGTVVFYVTVLAGFLASCSVYPSVAVGVFAAVYLILNLFFALASKKGAKGVEFLILLLVLCQCLVFAGLSTYAVMVLFNPVNACLFLVILVLSFLVVFQSKKVTEPEVGEKTVD